MNNAFDKLKFNKFSKRLTLTPSVVAFFLLPLCMFGCYTLVTTISPETYELYQELMVSSGIKKDQRKSTPYKVKQQRFNVQKDIAFVEKDQRMQLKLIASSTQMVLDHRHLENKEETRLVEQMSDVVCMMQDELYYKLADGREAVFCQGNEKLLLRGENSKLTSSYISKETKGLIPMQIVRVCQADKGFYDYQSDVFFAENTHIEHFKTFGHELIFSPDKMNRIMSGIAKSIEFSLDGKKMNFKANQMKASFFEENTPKSAPKTKELGFK